MAWILEARDESLPGAPFTERACGETGPGMTRFGGPNARAEAEGARRSLIGLGEGWTFENTRVREEP
jgi:hypothetical protein